MYINIQTKFKYKTLGQSNLAFNVCFLPCRGIHRKYNGYCYQLPRIILL